MFCRISDFRHFLERAQFCRAGAVSSTSTSEAPWTTVGVDPLDATFVEMVERDWGFTPMSGLAPCFDQPRADVVDELGRSFRVGIRGAVHVEHQKAYDLSDVLAFIHGLIATRQDA